MSFELLKTMCAIPGIPGNEGALRDFVRTELTPLSDEVYEDSMGNLFAVKRGTSENPRTIMLAAHLDEIGLVVKHITSTGFIYFHPLGGFDPRTLVAQRVKVHTASGVLDGCIAIKAAHFTSPEERNKVVPLKDLFIDLGLPGEKVKELVSVGDMITLERELIQMGDLYCGKTLDNRVGVYVMVEAMRRLQSSADTIVAVATVQEEIGVRGAKTASFGLAPDIGIAIDVTIAADTPGVDEKDYCVKTGGGAAIKILDPSMISHPKLVRFFKSVAEKYEIPHQMELLTAGGTDGAALQQSRGGIPTITLSIPNRYTHSVVEVVHKDDVEASIRLLTAVLEASHEFSIS